MNLILKQNIGIGFCVTFMVFVKMFTLYMCVCIALMTCPMDGKGSSRYTRTKTLHVVLLLFHCHGFDLVSLLKPFLHSVFYYFCFYWFTVIYSFPAHMYLHWCHHSNAFSFELMHR